MSEENVELVRSLQPAPETDLAVLFRDDATWEAAREGLGAVFDPDCESAIVMPGSGDAAARRTYRGIDGLRDAWLDWLAPWESYHVRIERLLDAGERVVVLPRDRGRRRGMEAEIESPVAAIWTVRDGRVIRAEFYASRDQALLDAGLRD